MTNDNSWAQILLIAAVLFVAYRAWSGWRQGVVRQALSILALVTAYAVAIFCGHLLVPLLRPLGYPDKILAIIGGAILGCIAFIAIAITSGIMFKKTAEQSVGVVRWTYGGLGAVLGASFGLFVVWVCIVAIRLLGTLAESHTTAPVAKPSAAHRTPIVARTLSVDRTLPGKATEVEVDEDPVDTATVPNVFAVSLVEMKHALEEGKTGAVLEHLDPIPEEIYTTINKIGQMVSSEQGIERFQEYPGVRELMHNPKLQALQQNPEISKAAQAGDYMGLLRNPQVVAAVNDPEVSSLLRGFKLDKALDYALKPVAPGLNRTGR